jgi:hypothetical protein
MTWQPIDTEPKNESPRLVSSDPTDPECAHLVTLTPGGHFNGDVILERMGAADLTHWHPVPVFGQST